MFIRVLDTTFPFVLKGSGFTLLTQGTRAGRQYIGDMPNSDLRQMMMTVDTNFWGTFTARRCPAVSFLLWHVHCKALSCRIVPSMAVYY